MNPWKWYFLFHIPNNKHLLPFLLESLFSSHNGWTQVHW
jgi:hypothetical protein